MWLARLRPLLIPFIMVLLLTYSICTTLVIFQEDLMLEITKQFAHVLIFGIQHTLSAISLCPDSICIPPNITNITF